MQNVIRVYMRNIRSSKSCSAFIDGEERKSEYKSSQHDQSLLMTNSIFKTIGCNTKKLLWSLIAFTPKLLEK